MKTIELNYDAEYASEVMDTIPAGYIDKTVCGCGLTTVAIENDEDTIILAPSRGLVSNKEAQYPNERCSFKVLGVDGNTRVSEINNYVDECMLTNQPIKIMVTYDSLRKVEHLLDVCRMIIDESDQILSLTKNSSRRESIFHMLDVAKSLKTSVTMLSATPTDLKYMPEWISEIDQVTMNWSNTIKAKPILAERTYPYKALREEFLRPLKDNGEVIIDGKSVKSVIVFVNSVTTIIDTIKELKLKKEDCAIVCGDSVKNDLKISGVNRYISGKAPKYLFVTSSGFAGIDIDAEDSMTIVVSNTSKSFTMVDLLSDLKQAVSRNRNKNNTHYGSYVYIYNQSVFNKTEEELINELDSLREGLKGATKIINDGIKNDQLDAVDILIRNNKDYNAYTIINDDTGLYEINEVVFNADRYFILELRNQYTKGFNIQSVIGHSETIKPIELPKSVSYVDLVEYFNKSHKNGVCEWNDYYYKTEWINVIEACYKLFKKTYNNITEAKQMIEAYGDEYKILVVEARKLFKKGERYSNADIKNTLQKFYDKKKLNRKAKATDMFELFGETGVKSFNTKGIRGIEIK